MSSFEVFMTEDNIRLVCVAGFWLECIMATLLMGRQIVYIKKHKWKDTNLSKYPQYTESIFHLSGMQMHKKLVMDIKAKLFTTSIWTVTIYSDIIPFMWDNFQLADSQFDFTPNFLDLEIRKDISFGFWFALFELLVLDFPVKFFEHRLLKAYGLYDKSMRYWVRNKFEETLLNTMHKTVTSFFLSFFINVYDNQTTGYHTLFRHTILAIIYCITLFVVEFLEHVFTYMDRDSFKPIPEGLLKDRLAAICTRTGYPLDKVYIEVVPPNHPMNAYCVSFFGLYTRIVIISSLIEGFYDEQDSNKRHVRGKRSPGLTISELEGIFAHEVGHWVKRHNEKNDIFASIFCEPILFVLAMWSREQKMLYQAFHFSPSDISSLPYPLLPGLFIGEQIICRVLDKTIYSFWNSVGCAMEREADMFSVPIRYAEKLKTGLVKLKMLVLGYPSTDPVYSLFYDHHPSLVERIRSIEQEQAATPK